MAEPLHRTQILLREDQHRQLSSRARQEGRSVSDLLRTLVDDGLERWSTEKRARVARRLQALETIRQHHRELLEERGGQPIEMDAATLIREVREERDDELFGRLTAGGG